MWGGACRLEEKYFAMIAPLLSSYLDESSDKEQKQTLCVGGLLISQRSLDKIQGAWIERLATAEIAYFSFTDCKGLHGEFLPYRAKYKSEARNMADSVLADLESILLSGSWIGFGLAVLIADYERVLAEIPVSSVFYEKDPTELAYGQIMCDIARAVRKEAPNHAVAYFVDESSDYPKIAHGFRAIKSNHPIIGKTMMTVAALDDKGVPALQMADLIVGVVRESIVAWLKSGNRYSTLDDKWRVRFEKGIARWDGEHTMKNLKATLRSHKFISGTIANRLLPKPSASQKRRQEKLRRKSLVEARIKDGI